MARDVLQKGHGNKTDLQLVKTGARFFWSKSRVQAQPFTVGDSDDGCAPVKMGEDANEMNRSMHTIWIRQILAEKCTGRRDANGMASGTIKAWKVRAPYFTMTLWLRSDPYSEPLGWLNATTASSE